MSLLRGLSSPVIVPPRRDFERDYSNTTLGELVSLNDEQLAALDPLAMNLIVAKGIPSLTHLDVSHYQETVRAWVRDFKHRCLPKWERSFHQSPGDFKNDIDYFRLGMVCQYLDLEVGIQYNRHQRETPSILYTDPSDLFLNGVIDTKEGTCGNMAALHVAFGWRMGWPVSLACVNSHYVLRYDDGKTTHNIEATQAGFGGFKSDPDEFLIEEKKLPRIAIESGSDLRALLPREMLGAFVSLRARHLLDIGRHANREDLARESESDWLLARYLFPKNRLIYRNQMGASTMRGVTLFDPTEAGHPQTFPLLLEELQARWRPPKPRASVAGKRVVNARFTGLNTIVEVLP